MLKRSVRMIGWWLLMLALLLAFLFTAVRVAVPWLSSQRDNIATYLSTRLGVNLAIDGLEAGWKGYLPELRISGVRVFAAADEGPEVRLAIDRIEIEPDPWRSLLQWRPVFHRLELSGAKGIWRQRDGVWLHRPGAEAGGLTEAGWRDILGLILLQPQLGINGAQLTLVPQQGQSRTLQAAQLLLENAGEQHQLSGDLRLLGLDDEAQLNFAVQAFNTPVDPLQGGYAFYLKLDSLGPELFELFDVQQRPQQLRAGTELWGRWSAGALSRLQGRLAVGELVWGEPESRVELHNSHVDYALIPRQDGYQLQLNDLYLSNDQSSFELSRLAVDGRWREGRVEPLSVQLEALDLNALQHWLQSQTRLPAPVREALSALNPRGFLRRVRMEWPEGGNWPAFSVRADAERLELEAYYGAPSVAGVSGLIEADLQGGRLHLQSNDFSLHFPRVFDQGWSFVQADGTIRWSLRPDGVLIDSGLLHLREDSVGAAGRFSIDIPYAHSEQTELTLLIGMTDSDGRRPERYVPRKEVGEGLYRWLGSAIGNAHLRQGGLLLHGGTRHLEPHQPPTVQLFFDIAKAQLQYDPAWPPIRDADLFLMIRNGDLRADLRSGKLLDTDIRGGFAYKALQDERLQVAVLLEGPGSDVDRVLRSPPLVATLGDGLGDWALNGKVTGQLRLAIPINGAAAPVLDIAVDVALSAGQLSSKRLDLQLDAVSGPLRFSSQGGLSSPGLSAQLFGQAVSGKIATRNQVTTLSLQGQTPMQAIRDWSGVAALELLQGTLPWSSQLVLCSAEAGCRSHFALQSNLRGVGVELPAGYGLERDESAALTVDVQLGDAPILGFNYRDLLRGRFDLAASAPRGSLRLGGQAPVLQPGAGLYVDGRVAQLDAGALSALISRLSQLAADEGGSQPLRRIDIDVDRFELGSMALRSVHGRVQPQAQGWSVRLDAEQVAGVIEVPAGQTPIRVSLDRLLLDGSGDADSPQADAAGADSALEFDAASVPAVNIAIGQLGYNGLALGRWEGQLRSEGNSLRLQALSAKLSQLQLQGEAYWQQAGAGHTGVTLQVEGEDIGKQLEEWGFDRAIESESLKAQVQLEWSGAPWSMAAERLAGAVQFDARNGRLIESGNSANLLRVFGILNFNTLGRRLRLDFSDLFKKGVVFDRLKGRYRIDAGIASTESPLEMKGPSADLKARGELDLVHETVDKEIEVVLPVTGNVPFAAVLLGAPQVAGAVFLIDKLIGDKLERVTTLKYRLSGDWGDPQVELLTEGAAAKESK